MQLPFSSARGRNRLGYLAGVTAARDTIGEGAGAGVDPGIVVNPTQRKRQVEGGTMLASPVIVAAFHDATGKPVRRLPPRPAYVTGLLAAQVELLTESPHQ